MVPELCGGAPAGEVVVSACVEAGHLVAPAVAGGEDEHGPVAVALAPVAQHGKAVFGGQAQVEHGRVVRLHAACEGGGFAVVLHIRHKTRFGQGLAHLLGQGRVVFHDEDSHGKGLFLAEVNWQE